MKTKIVFALAFAGAMQALLDNVDERIELGRRARALARTYAPERMARAMADIYARVTRPHHALVPIELAGAA